MRLRSVFAAAVAGLVALALAACSPGDDEPTASPTVASPTPTEVATTPSPMATPSPTPTLTQEEVHVAEATETLKQFIQVGSDIVNAGGVGGEALDPYLGTPALLAEYAAIWSSLISSGTYTVGTPAISQVSVNSYGQAGLLPAVELRYCLDNSGVRQFDATGAEVPRPGNPTVVLFTTLQSPSEGVWTVLVHNQTDESC